MLGVFAALLLILIGIGLACRPEGGWTSDRIEVGTQSRT
jgi:hypothetical protein